jgi:hypothetical protein
MMAFVISVMMEFFVMKTVLKNNVMNVVIGLCESKPDSCDKSKTDPFDKSETDPCDKSETDP